jgi:hypothetical protein
MINDEGNKNSNSTASSLTEYPRYRGPTKLVWEDGRQIRKPDLSYSLSPNSSSSLTTNSARGEFKYQKTLNEVISDTDKTRFSKLPNDEERYQMISNMITGEGNNHPNQLFPNRFVHGDPRDLISMLEDLVKQDKIYFNPQDGNFYTKEYSIEHKMRMFPCRNCSKVLFSEEERTRHAFSHMQQQE